LSTQPKNDVNEPLIPLGIDGSSNHPVVPRAYGPNPSQLADESTTERGRYEQEPPPALRPSLVRFRISQKERERKRKTTLRRMFPTSTFAGRPTSTKTPVETPPTSRPLYPFSHFFLAAALRVSFPYP
jgi:hypothetical protein